MGDVEILSIKLVLPLPPSLNRLYRTVKRKSKTGKTYYGLRKTEEGRMYSLEVLCSAVAQDVPIEAIKQVAGMVNWKVDMQVFFPDKRRRDLDNVEKELFDSLAKVLGFDDKQIVDKHSQKLYDKENPRVEVELIAIDKKEKE